jgi:hypothetical protein
MFFTYFCIISKEIIINIILIDYYAKPKYNLNEKFHQNMKFFIFGNEL